MQLFGLTPTETISEEILETTWNKQWYKFWSSFKAIPKGTLKAKYLKIILRETMETRETIEGP